MTIDLAASPFFDDQHTERIEEPGSYYHTFDVSIPGNHPSAKFAVPKAEIIFPDLDGDIRAFVIKEVAEETGTDGVYKRISAEDAAQEELLSLVMFPATNTSDTAAEILEDILAGSRWQVGTVEATATDVRTHTWDYETRWEAVMWVSEQFDLEVHTRVIVTGNRITARYIDLLESRGTYTGQVIRYNGDTASMTRNGDGGEVYTAAVGLGAEGLTFADSEWTTAGGDPVNKPETQVWVGDEDARYGSGESPAYGIVLADGSVVHRMGVARFGDEDNSGRLLARTWEWLQERTSPRYTYDVSLVALERMPPQQPGDLPRSWERVRIGDVVIVQDSMVYPPYRDEARVTEIRRSYSDPTQDGITLGKPTKRRLADYLRDSIRYMR